MGPDQAISIGEKALTITLTLALPLLVVGLVVGVLISIIQAVTQIQEQTLTFVPKLAGVALVIVITGHWMLAQIISFTQGLFEMIPHLIAS